MTIRELIESLEALEARMPDASVSVAIQPSYPLECRIKAVQAVDGVVWIAASEGHGYTDSRPWEGDCDD